MTMCESTRGKWGDVCPDCGVRLPPLPGPLGERSRKDLAAFGNHGRPWSDAQKLAHGIKPGFGKS